MRTPIYTLLLLLLSLPSSAQAPLTEYAHFKLDAHELIWQQVIDTTISDNDIKMFYAHLSKVKDVFFDGSSIEGIVHGVTVDYRRYGYTWSNALTVSTYSTIRARLKVDRKEDRYRITLYDIKFIAEGTDDRGDYTDFSTYMLKRDHESLKPTMAANNVLGIYDKFFQDYFRVKPSARNADF